jgi:hypothetical protein
MTYWDIPGELARENREAYEAVVAENKQLRSALRVAEAERDWLRARCTCRATLAGGPGKRRRAPMPGGGLHPRQPEHWW